MSAPSNSEEPAADMSEMVQLEQERTLDQTACGDQDELKKGIGSDNEQSRSDMIVGSTTKEETGRLEGQTATANTGQSSNSDLKTLVARMGENTGECDPSAETTSVPVKDCLSSEPVCNSSEDSVKDSSISAVEDRVTGCPERQKMRRQKEKPFLNKNQSCGKFVWNKCLLRGFEGAVHPDWILHIVNGFVGQSGILLNMFHFLDRILPVPTPFLHHHCSTVFGMFNLIYLLSTHFLHMFLVLSIPHGDLEVNTAVLLNRQSCVILYHIIW